MKINWSQITPIDFEKLCAVILEILGFTNLQWFGKSGGDKGRDIVAKKEESPLPASRRIATWVVQCKLYLSKPPSKRDIQSFLVDALEHNPDHVLFIVTNTLTPDTKDWIETITQLREYPFDIHCWEELDLEREIAKHKSEIAQRLPKLFSQPNPVIIEDDGKNPRYVFSFPDVQKVQIIFMGNNSEENPGEDLARLFGVNDDDNFGEQQKNRGHRKRRSG